MLQETELNATKLKPDVMVFTETNFLDENKKLLGAPLAQYKMYHSCKPYMNPSGRRHQVERSRAGSAGVTIAVKNMFLMLPSVTPVRIEEPAAKGHCKVVQIMPPGSDCLIIWGVYIPHDPEERKHVYAMLRSAVAKAEAEVPADRKCFSIMAGDWNAALLEGDRAELTSDDSAHQQLIAELAMTPTQQRTEQARPATHHPQGENVPSSRIDDVLMSEGLAMCKPSETQVTVTTLHC